ncbi:DNA-3-methyladenine glycosylase family protein [Enhydrobacter aerosaccus]|uniref:DNA-3-methyladenine glycosylase family protein n=1 Tax=Enhydrobacter aerosaccus TaxID=225324 RepID=UPI001115C4E0|nr:DNA-3-methyladenine glycosylase [Enhydrobacter aerosaccus]
MADWTFDCRRAVRHLKTSDPALGAIITNVGPFVMELKTSRSLFGALAEAIVYQQLSTKAAATIYGRLEALFPRSIGGFTPRDILQTPVDKLRGVGLSAAKVLALHDLARRVDNQELPTLQQANELEDAVLIERLVQVRGIGRWSAEMFLMFRLGRPDVLPLDDYSLRKAYAAAFGKRQLPAPRTLERHGEKWRPYRTVASWYLWRTLDLTDK